MTILDETAQKQALDTGITARKLAKEIVCTRPEGAMPGEIQLASTVAMGVVAAIEAEKHR